jgi:hypothetical protein
MVIGQHLLEDDEEGKNREEWKGRNLGGHEEMF